MEYEYDIVIVVSGLAGLRAAVEIKEDARVAAATSSATAAGPRRSATPRPSAPSTG